MSRRAITVETLADHEITFRLAVVKLVYSLVRPAGVPAAVKFVAIIFLALVVFGSFVAALFLANWGIALQQHKDLDCRPYLAYYSINSLMMLVLAVLVIPKLQEAAESRRYGRNMNDMFAKRTRSTEGPHE